MATVFRSYADLSSLMPAAVFSLLLLIFDNIGAVFIASGLFALARRLDRPPPAADHVSTGIFPLPGNCRECRENSLQV